MNKPFLIALFAFLFSLGARAQSCLPNGITFQNQQEVDNFPIDYPGCTNVLGNLDIDGYDIANLNGLSNITSIGGNLVIDQQPTLTDLDGLNNLITVGQGVFLTDIPNLTSLHGLENLSSVGTVFYLQGLPSLQYLSNLENLATVGYNFEITQCLNLISISGLNKLISVGGDLVIHPGNANGFNSLTNLDGFAQLTRVGGNLQIGSDSLSNLNGLDSLKTVGNVFSLVANTDKFRFGNMDSVGQLAIQAPIKNLDGFPRLKYSREGLVLGGPSLESLQGMPELTRLNGLSLYSSHLKSLTGLEKIDTLYGLIDIEYNGSLTTLTGLNNVKYFEGEVLIKNNPNLSDCSIAPFCRNVIPSDKLTLSNNATGCNDWVELPLHCRFPVEVEVLRDNNNNCISDSTDTPAMGLPVRLSNASQLALSETDSNGIARLSVSRWDFFTLDLPHFPGKNWALCQDSIFTDPPGLLDTLRQTFLLEAITQCPELTVTLGLPSFFRGCLVNSDLQVKTQNTGTVLAEGAKVALVMPQVLELVSALPPPAAQIGDTLYFDLGDLNPFENAVVQLSVKTKCDTFLVGQTLCIETFASLDNPCPNTLPAFSEIRLSVKCIGDTLVRFTLKNIGDAPTQGPHQYTIIRNDAIVQTGTFSLANQQSTFVDVSADGATYRMEATQFDNGALTATALEHCGGLTPGQITAFWLDKGPLESDFDCRQVVGSFDPNLKSAVPTGAGSDYTITANRPIQYTIDFQNTGTDTAYRVLLRDVLPAGFDLTTFRPGASSHPCTWEIRGNTLDVLFSPIMLPDSNANEPASHGFFSFTLDQTPDLPEGTSLQNTASIIFDFNPPIGTNTVYHRIGRLTVAVDAPQRYADLWRVAGNPTRDVATFSALTVIAGEKRFELYDAAGQRVHEAQFSGQAFVFQRDGLPCGVYFFRIGDKQGRWFTGRIVVAD